MSLPVVWLSYSEQTPARGYWDTSMLEALFSHEPWRPVGAHEFEHLTSLEGLEGAFLHIVGKPAHGDRNGVMLMMYAMQRSRADFELVVKSQTPIEPLLKDPRITWDSSAPDDQWRLYAGFDALIIPRRYGGLCLPMNEGLTSGLPVIMSNTSPNNAILPHDWLIPGGVNGGFVARMPIQYFNVNIAYLARKLDEWATMPDEVLDQHKARALELSRQFDPEMLRPQYEAVMSC